MSLYAGLIICGIPVLGGLMFGLVGICAFSGDFDDENNPRLDRGRPNEGDRLDQAPTPALNREEADRHG